MKAILAVNLEEALTVGLAAALDRRGLGARLRSVPSPKAAEALREGSYDLVVIDLAEQAVPPAGLLPALAEVSPDTCLVVLAGSAVVQAPDRPAMFDGIEVLERALPLEDLFIRIAAALQRGVKGHLENVGLAAFIQLLAIEKESCTLEVRSAGRTGTVRFVRGDLWDAQAGAKQGDEAAIEIFGWETVDVDMSGVGQQARRTITASLTYLLIEAMRRRDELVRDQPAPQTAARGEGGGDRQPSKQVTAGGHGSAGAVVGALIRELEGFIAVCLVEAATGRTVEARTMRADLDLELASAFSRESLHQVRELIGALRLSSAMEDLLFTFSDEVHLIRPSTNGFFVYLVADRAQTGYPQMRAALHKLWPAFEADALSRGLPRQAEGPGAAISPVTRDR
ncbi:MAG TPA: DUF4388 domain-containing protein [Thermoanaerobaculia bacterium]|nr:DUF4388 domain-containing protein [Thermoanaerobaculia bacterium]